MLNESVLNEENERVSKTTITILSVGLILFVGAATIFVGLAILNGSQNDYYSELRDTRKTENTQLKEEQMQKTTERDSLKIKNEELTETNNSLTITHTELVKANATLHSEIEELNSDKKKVRNHLIICGSVSGISLLANGLIIPYYYSLRSKISTLETEIEHFQPLYYKAMDYSLSSFLQSRERSSWYKMNSLYDGSGTLSQSSFKTAVNGKEDTASLYQTDSGEVMGFVLHEKWAFGSEITDNTAFTFSFRKFLKASKTSGSPAVNPDSGLFLVGNNEIALFLNKTGTAKTNQGYTPSKVQEDSSDFYVSSGKYTLSQIQVYQFATSSRS